MVFRVVDKSSFTFETDIPPSLRNTHPSGILHAFRSTAPKNGIISCIRGQNDRENETTAHAGKEEYTFAWIDNAIHIEGALNDLEELGFDRSDGIVFIPYSTKSNWLVRYPHAAPALEYTKDNKLVSFLNCKLYKGDGSGEHRGQARGPDPVETTALREKGPNNADSFCRPPALPPMPLCRRDVCAERSSQENEKQDNEDDTANNFTDDDTTNNVADGSNPKKRSAESSSKEGYLTLDYAQDSKVVSYLNWKVHDGDGSGDHQGQAQEPDPVETMADVCAVCAERSRQENEKQDEDNTAKNDVTDSNDIDTTNNVTDGSNPKRKRRKTRKTYMLPQDSSITDAERDELHIEIYNYLSWLHDRMAELEKKTLDAELQGAFANMEEDDIEPVAMEAKRAEFANKFRGTKGIDAKELRCVVDKLEAAFLVVPLHISEEEGVEPAKGPPFLEDALSKALDRLVSARELSGNPGRRKRRRRRGDQGNNRKGIMSLKDFEGLFQKLVKYKEEHGDCAVPGTYHDKHLANWVRKTRSRKSQLQKKGIEVEEVAPGEIQGHTLTAERLERLNSMGFVWSVMIPWEDRFRDLMEHYEANGKWPSQSSSLGEWVHKQRIAYAKGDKKYMEERAPRLDEVGFEWTPRGNTKLPWDEGFEMLMEFGRINGHFDVPCPPPETNGKEHPLVDFKSDAYKLYRWVMSLHIMYKSYTLGRKAGSLTEERVVLLTEHGFNFRDSWDLSWTAEHKRRDYKKGNPFIKKSKSS